MYCINCGKENREGAIFCCSCGRKVNVMEVSSVENTDTGSNTIESEVKKNKNKKTSKEKKDKLSWREKSFLVVPMVMNVFAIIVMFLPYCETIEAKHSFMDMVISISAKVSFTDIKFVENTSSFFAIIIIVISLASLSLYAAKFNLAAVIVTYINVAALSVLYFLAIPAGVNEFNSKYAQIDLEYAQTKIGAIALIIVILLLGVGTIVNYIAVKMINEKKK